MARTDAIVLGAGIVGISAALHLAKRGLAVALVDRRGPGEETSYGNTGIIEGNTLFAACLPEGLRRAAADCAEAGAGGELSSVVPAAARAVAAGLSRQHARRARACSSPRRCARCYARAVAEHEALMAEAGATRYLRKDGWLKLYRSDESFAATERERDYATELGLDAPRARAPRRRARSSRRSRRCSVMPCIGRMPRACPIRSRSPRPMRRGSPRSAASSLKGDARTLHRSGDALARRHRRRADRCQGRRGRARALGAGRARAARHRPAAGVQARLSPAFPPARQRRPDAADRRHRLRLLPRADGAGHPADHRRGIRRPRCGADAGAVRPRAAGGARRCFRWARRSKRSPGWDRGRALPIHAR